MGRQIRILSGLKMLGRRVLKISQGILLVLFVAWISIGAWYASPNPQHRAKYDSGAQALDRESTDLAIARYTWWLAFFTSVLAISTIGLWIVTWRSGVRQSRDMRLSIDIARRSSDAVIQMEMAHLFPVVEIYNFDHAVARPVPAMVRFRFKNYGKTPAILVEVSALLVPVQELRQGFGFHVIESSPFDVISPGDTTKEYTVKTEVTRERADLIRKADSFLWFYGGIRWWDVWGMQHSRRFCWRYDGLNRQFKPFGWEGYNDSEF